MATTASEKKIIRSVAANSASCSIARRSARSPPPACVIVSGPSVWPLSRGHRPERNVGRPRRRIAMSFTDQAWRRGCASRVLATANRGRKDAALHAMADALAKAETAVLEANAADVERAEQAGTAAGLLDRLRLTPDRIEAMADGLRSLAGLADPVGDVVRGWTTAQGRADRAGPGAARGDRHHLRGPPERDRRRRRDLPQVRATPCCCAARPRPPSPTRPWSRRSGPAWSGPVCPPTPSSWSSGPREVTGELMAARGLVDVLIPRGGAELIETVVRTSVVPVIETGVGNCHLYVDRPPTSRWPPRSC